jgi:uncharacterized protein YoxC
MQPILRKLITESPNYELEYLVEEKNTKEASNLYIKGPFIQTEIQNRNNRIYRLEETVKEVSRFTKEMIDQKRALGELNHPQSAEINPRDACHMIIELKQNGNNFIGKSKVLSTPLGTVVRSLIMDGAKLGVSTRALGKLNKQGEINEVSDLRLITCDVVADPSAPSCFLDGILEAKQYVINSDGTIMEALASTYETLESQLSTLPKHETDLYLRNAFTDFIKNLRNCTKNQ